MKRPYNLDIPSEVSHEIDRIGDIENKTTIAIIIQAIKLLLILYALKERGGKIVVQDENGERELTLF